MSRSERRPTRTAFHVALVTVLGLGALSFGGCEDTGGLGVVFTAERPPVTNRPIEDPTGKYVSSDTCRACHVEKYETWAASYHKTMTQVVSPETVLAPFDGVELDYRDQHFVLEQRGDEYWVEMFDPDWEGEGERTRVWRQIVMSTGSHHFQAYWFATGKTRKLSIFLFCYRIDTGEWMPVDAAFLASPELHRKPGLGRWNLGCQQCHATKAQPRATGPDEMDSRAAEFGIACEACHGPGEDHIRANRNPLRRYGLHLGNEVDATIVDPADLSPKLASQACGQCHGASKLKNERYQRHFNDFGHKYRPGDELTDRREFPTDDEKLFWSDGMVRVSGREYNGLIRSPCYTHDSEPETMTCMSCHQMHYEPNDAQTLEEWKVHQLKPGMRTNQACTQCHTEYESESRLAEHTHHTPSSSGSSCYNCHMPHTSWGLLKGIRAHEISSPTVAASLETGRPTACNLCHLDRSLAWTADRLNGWYGQPVPEMNDDARDVAASVLWLLSGDAGQRALMSFALGWEPAREISGEDWLPPYLSQLLEDPYDAVRFRAHRSLTSLEGFEDLEYDFVGPEEDRAAAHAEALRRWRAKPHEGNLPDREAVLLDLSGALDQAGFERLLHYRDDKKVVLAE